MNTRKYIIGLVLLALAAAIPAQAQLTIGSTVTASSGTFHYNYTVSNLTSDEFAIITLDGLTPGMSTVKNLMSPTGFDASYDSGLGLLSFLEDTAFFSPGSVVGKFSFDSPYAPLSSTFEGLDISGDLTIGSAFVPAGMPASPVPEPSTTAAAGALVLVGLAAYRKFKRTKSST